MCRLPGCHGFSLDFIDVLDFSFHAVSPYGVCSETGIGWVLPCPASSLSFWVLCWSILLPFRLCPELGVRIGEARHPGPGSNTFRMCITNPTCVSNKFDVYNDLLRLHNCQLISMSETAATLHVQKDTTRRFRSKKCKLLWSPPVQPLTQTISGIAHSRGRASGVAVLSSLPIRPSRLDLDASWATTARFVHGIVRMAESHVQVVTLYCEPVHGSNQVAFNSELLQMALEQVSVIPLPYVILGDFSMPVTSSEAWPQLAAAGCLSLDVLFEQRFAEPMPATCNGATITDNAIISPCLVGCVENIRGLESTWFATHAPVLFDLKLPGSTIYMRRLKMPKQLVSLNLDDDAFDTPGISECFRNVQTLEGWGQAVEGAVDIALRAGKGSEPVLTKAYMGRCRPLKIVKSPVFSPVKPACESCYEPSTEAVTITARRRVKQVRRLEAFHRRLQKAKASPVSWSVDLRLKDQFLQEWKTIIPPRAFGQPFLLWLRGFPDMDFPPVSATFSGVPSSR